MTLQDRFEAALIARGAKHDSTARSTKYRTFVLNGKRYYLGKSGALRVGASITNSHPLSDRMRALLLNDNATRATTIEMDI